MTRAWQSLCGILGLGLVACGGDGSTSGGSGSATPEAARPSAGCQAAQRYAGSSETLSWGGVPRTFTVHVPASYSGKTPVPLLVDVHGLMSNGSQQAASSLTPEKADQEGFIVVHPEGTGSPVSWNAGDCCAFSDPQRDDVGFIAAMLDSIEERSCIDERRVYVTGMSNGGFLSHRLACELSDRVAAIAPVSGVMGIDPCTPSRPVPVMHFHGTADPLVPYAGGQPQYFNLLFPNQPPPTFRSVAETIAGWVARNGCSGDPAQTFAKGDSHCETYSQCTEDAEVTLCTVDGGGHTWPGGATGATSIGNPALSGILGPQTQDLHATDAMWTFFQGHVLP